ncbi:MAG: D-alanyl-D-alanine carboxypeptidase [Magnetococcales bacterium]|nr:D-alanyl-D-alanine carboxypeptidase [Magnetococcales bacterium]MBF0150928.1 D-alanyl-D-alanine carboxypeptidase [Magnetococcales bacterium]MBF0631980.1 D-alanyl-D-alanine carboxypeptidase [Magnetococcales bacterium]
MFLLTFFFLSSTAFAVDPDKSAIDIRATSAILGDLDTGVIMFEKDADKVVPPASLTKIMTLYLIYEALARGDLNLEQKLPVSERAWRTAGSKTFVKVGDEIKVDDLIRGIAVQSGNDACVVVAEHLAGSEAGFADLMNARARELGLSNSHFINPTGLPDPQHYTSARDLFKLASAIMNRFPEYSYFVREKQYTFSGIQQYNRNRLLWRDPSITGLKTGHTREAGYCLVATSEKEGQRLSAVILGSTGSKVREEDALRLLRFGNRMYETVRIYEPGALIRSLRIWKGQEDFIDATVETPVVVTIPRKERSSLEVGMVYEEPMYAPLEKGQKIGAVIVKFKGQEILNRPVVAAKELPSGGIVGRLMDSVRLYFGW